MATSVQIPPLGESVTQAVLVKWHKKEGDRVSRDEPLCELETDKANVDVPSPAEGIIKLKVQEGATIEIGQEIAAIEAAEGGGAPAAEKQDRSAQEKPAHEKPAAAVAAPASTAARQEGTAEKRPAPEPAVAVASPAAQRIAAETGIDPATVTGSGRGGRVTKEDMTAAVESNQAGAAAAPQMSKTPQPKSPKTSSIPEPGQAAAPAPQASMEAGVRREPMSKIRRKIAERLVAAQQTAAILTTFNEVDLTGVQELRSRYKERFAEVHGVGLGLMSFFARACVQGLREFPRINAFVEGGDVIFHDYVHLGIAVSTERGLAVPVLRNAQAMTFAQIESEIRRLATSARDGKLAIDELSGGTFTITNGGVFGSLLSTPILNPPQSGILGMHTIQKRPVAIGDKVEVRPMMYIALSYDHRLVDGRDSVSFLVRLKQLLEDPARLMLEI